MRSAVISLLAMRADIIYDPTLIQPSNLTKQIGDLGFSAQILEVGRAAGMPGDEGTQTLEITVSLATLHSLPWLSYTPKCSSYNN